MPHTSTARPTVAPAGIPVIVMVPWLRLRNPVPAAAAPHGLQLVVIPTGTSRVAGPTIGAFEACAVAELRRIVLFAVGALHRIVSTTDAPGASLSTFTV